MSCSASAQKVCGASHAARRRARAAARRRRRRRSSPSGRSSGWRSRRRRRTSSISSCRCPPRIDSRERKSTHTLCPRAERRCSGARGFGGHRRVPPSGVSTASSARARAAMFSAVKPSSSSTVATRCRGAEAVEAEHVAVAADPLPPAHRSRPARRQPRGRPRAAAPPRGTPAAALRRAPCRASRRRARACPRRRARAPRRSVGATSAPVEIRISSGVPRAAGESHST